MLCVTQWFPGSLHLIFWEASFISTKIWRSHLTCTTSPGRAMLVSHSSSTEWWGFVTFTWGQFHRKWPWHRSLEWVWKLYVWYNTLFPGPQWQSFVSRINPLCRSFRWITPSRGSFHNRFFLHNSNSMVGKLVLVKLHCILPYSYKILHMPWQHSCHAMCKISWQSLH